MLNILFIEDMSNDEHFIIRLLTKVAPTKAEYSGY